MYKNQLQELAQRSCFNLPAYSCIREGPDHAPRFKATVNFNGEIFESPNYCSTLRQAEHAAAEVALNILSRRGPSQSLAARILDETGVCKNLLQETAQRAGVSLPVYTTIRSGPGHLPVFKCIVEVAGRTFVGDPAKTKKQAEKNAAMAAWSAIKLLTSSHPPLLLDSESSEELERSYLNALVMYRRDERRAAAQNHASQMQSAHNYGGRRVRVVNVRDRNRRTIEGSPVGQFHLGSSSSSVSGEISFEAGQNHGRYLYNQQPCVAIGSGGSTLRPAMHQRRHSLSGVESPMLSRESMAATRATGGAASANVGRVMPLQQQQIRGLPLQSRSERFELRQPLLEELHQRDEDEWMRGEAAALRSSMEGERRLLRPLQQQQQQIRGLPLQSRSERFQLKQRLLEELHERDEEEWRRQEGGSFNNDGEGVQQHSSSSGRGRSVQQQQIRGLPLQSRSERFDPRPSLLEELHQRDEDDWLRPKMEKREASAYSSNDGEKKSYGEVSYGEKKSYGEKSLYAAPSSSSSSSSSMWSRSAQWWGAHLPSSPSSAAAAIASTFGLRSASSLAPPVRVRQMVPVCSAPPPRRPEVAPPRPPAQNLRDSDPSSSSSSAAAAAAGDGGEASTRKLFNQLRL